MNRAEEMMQALKEDGLPNVGFEITPGRTALVVTDPQNDFLHPDGVAYGVCGESIRENDTVENLKQLMEVASETGMPLFISPHYYYPTDHGWKFEGTLERVMHSIGMFDRKGALSVDGFDGSGADWLQEYKPFIENESTIVCNPHKLYGPENNDLVLQLRKQHIDKVVLAGMSANLCTESHLRELLETGFEVAVVADATAAAKVPGLDGFLAAFINYRMLSSAVWTTSEATSMMRDAHSANVV
jgi:nicotinamidase-related amidase